MPEKDAPRHSPKEFGELTNSVVKPSPEFAIIVLFLSAHRVSPSYPNVDSYTCSSGNSSSLNANWYISDDSEIMEKQI